MDDFLIDAENDRFSLKSFFQKGKNKNLKNYLDLSFKNLGDLGISQLLLQPSFSLVNIHTIYLGTNQLTSKGINSLCVFLRDKKNYVKHLSLESNFIEDQGCLHLARMLEHNLYLQSLIIGGNSIRDTGATYISESLLKNNNLKNLVLVNNDITQETLYSFIKSLKSNNSLTRFSLGFKCSPNQGLQLNSIFNVNTSLLDCLMDFENPNTERLFSYNLNFNRYLNCQRKKYFTTTTSFFIDNFLIGFYKSSSFYRILPTELSILIANFTGVYCKSFIKTWERKSRQIWKKKHSTVYGN